MKNLIIIFLALFVVFNFTADSYSIDSMLGAKAGYYYWEPYYKGLEMTGASDIGWGSGALYGPIMSVVFIPDISFSIAGLAGKQSSQAHVVERDYNGGKQYGTSYFKVFRVDIDSALSYRLNEFFKIFGGYKYQYLDVTWRYTSVRTNASGMVTEVQVEQLDNMKNKLHGPALGFGYSIPLSGKYFLAANISGLYMIGKAPFKGSSYSTDNSSTDPITYNKQETTNIKLRQCGFNFEPSIGMAPEGGFPIISLGFRYQRLWVKMECDDPKFPAPSHWVPDTIIGVFVSALKMF